MTTNKSLSPEERSDLQIEYQTCQQVANNATSGYWAFAGIFLALSSIILAVIITALFQEKWLVLVAFITIWLSVGMWTIYFALWQMLIRANETQGVVSRRMLCIEQILGTILMRQRLNEADIGTRGLGARWYKLILIVLAALWLILLVTAWVLVIMY